MSASASPDDLVRPGEDVPLAVQRTAQFLAQRGVWYLLSRNSAARSCRDAAHKRDRLGHVGIPLWDELKSFFGQATLRDGRQQFVVVHCRGDRLLDLERVQSSLDLAKPPERIEASNLETLGMAYGLVNPFESWTFDGQLLSTPVLQVFDTDLLTPIGIPGTVMTNAGDLTWGVELRAQDLADRLDHVSIGEVSMIDPEEPRPFAAQSARPTIGIITGNAPESGIALWNHVNEHVRGFLGVACYGDVSMPRVIVDSIPELGQSMELAARSEPVWDALRRACVDLCRAQARVIGLACNTTQYFTPRLREICGEYGAEFVSMPEAVALSLRNEGVKQVGLIGISYVTDLDGWSAYGSALAGIDVELPDESIVGRIEELAYLVKAEGANQRGLNGLRDLSRRFHSKHLVLALTELSVLLDLQKRPGRSGKVLIDPLAVYAEALASRFLGVPFPLQTLDRARRSVGGNASAAPAET
jgi:aspartate/glutamate racemase